MPFQVDMSLFLDVFLCDLLRVDLTQKSVFKWLCDTPDSWKSGELKSYNNSTSTINPIKSVKNAIIFNL